jgi:Fic family protein
LAGVPLRPDVAKQLHGIYLAKGAHATTAIEGNSLSEDQVRALVERRLQLPKSQEYLAGYNEIMDRLLTSDDDRIEADEIKSFNGVVLQGLELEEDVVPGEYRRHRVVVARYLAPPAEDVQYLMERLRAWLNSADFETDDPDMQVACAIIKAVVAHVRDGPRARLLVMAMALSGTEG